MFDGVLRSLRYTFAVNCMLRMHALVMLRWCVLAVNRTCRFRRSGSSRGSRRLFSEYSATCDGQWESAVGL